MRVQVYLCRSDVADHNCDLTCPRWTAFTFCRCDFAWLCEPSSTPTAYLIALSKKRLRVRHTATAHSLTSLLENDHERLLCRRCNTFGYARSTNYGCRGQFNPRPTGVWRVRGMSLFAARPKHDWS